MMKKVFLILLGLWIGVNFNSCSKDEVKNDEQCFLYSIFLSDNCDCEDFDFLCGNLYYLDSDEYNRIIDLRNSTSIDCLEVTAETLLDATQSGYLISMDKSPCPDFDFGI